MTPQDPLADLHPLRDPAALSLWPPAPGWWLLGTVSVLAVLALSVWLYRRRRANAYRAEARGQLQALRARFNRDGDVLSYTQGLNALLKGTALAVFPRAEVAALHGSDWLAFLRSSAPGSNFSAAFSHAIYTGGTADIDVDELHHAAGHWLDRHRTGR